MDDDHPGPLGRRHPRAPGAATVASRSLRARLYRRRPLETQSPDWLAGRLEYGETDGQTRQPGGEFS